MRIFRHEQGLAKVESLVKHWRSNESDANRILRIALHWNQYVAGIGTPILENTTAQLSYLETVWFPDLRDFLRETNTTIEVDEPGLTPIQREYDQHIMDHVLGLQKFSRAELKRINYCRLFLDVQTISDISTACGKFLSRDLLDGNPSFETSRAKGLRAVQKKPTCKRTWQLWRQACTLLCSNKKTK